MTPRRRAAVELTLAAAAVLGCALSWLQARSILAVAPITDGQPATSSVAYDPPMLLLAMLLAMVAGVLAVAGGARLSRLRHR